MSTDIEKSFIARIACSETRMTFFDKHPDANQLTEAGHLLTTAHGYSRLQIMSRYYSNDTNNTHIIAYFRCYGDYYNIQIRSKQHFRKFFSKNDDRILGAFPAAGGDTTSFNLLDTDRQLVTLDDLKGSHAVVYLRARNAGIINRQLRKNPYVYTYGDAPGDSVTFNLEILERNVDYPTSTEPYLIQSSSVDR
jgi:hypothetical protein